MRRARLQLYIMTLLLFCAPPLSAATLRDQLEQQTDYAPRSVTVVDQLIEVARWFHIPMGIEWLKETDGPTDSRITRQKRSVLQLIKAIVKQSPQHEVVLRDQIVQVFSPALTTSRMNFLNLRIPHYELTDECVLGAEFQLRIAIDMLLYPELYKGGYNGGYGGAPGDVFWKRNLNFSGDNLTIREILNRISGEGRTTLWIAELSPEELQGVTPKWFGVPIGDHVESPLDGRWHFIAIVPEDWKPFKPEY